MDFSLSLDSCRSADDSFYIYERYMRSFQRTDLPDCDLDVPAAPPDVDCEYGASQFQAEEEADAMALPGPADDPSLTEQESLLDNDSDKPAAVSSDDTTRSDTSTCIPKPAIITLVSMENSNNATDGTRVFDHDPVFKLPNNELTFNGTLKHLQKLKPIVDPMAALSKIDYSETSELASEAINVQDTPDRVLSEFGVKKTYDPQDSESECVDVETVDPIVESYTNPLPPIKEESCSSMGLCKERESRESTASYDRMPSPDMFSDDDEWSCSHSRLQDVLSQHEVYDKLLLRKMEKTLSGVLPPPSVTTLRADVNDLLKKYYTFLPLFHPTPIETNTPSKGTCLVHIPTEISEPVQENETVKKDQSKTKTVLCEENEPVVEFHTAEEDVKVPVMGTEQEARETQWPDVLKCRYHDVHYNTCSYSERLERAATRVAQRYVAEEMASTVTVFSLANQSPSSAQKRKALRMKMAQSKSPGRRLSHLARRRQLFSAASLAADRAHPPTSKMVLIDKNFFPHRKLTYTTAERKSPRVRRTPGRKTPGKKTPGKKTPGKGSNSKKQVRRLPLDSQLSTRSQPTRETSKRALFQSPDNQKPAEPPQNNPRALKSRRNLFGSSCDDSSSLDSIPTERAAKRKRDSFDMSEDSSCQMHRSFSFCGESSKSQSSQTSLTRRATEVISGRKSNDMAVQRQKLLWAVSNALRAHGWRMGAPGFKDKAAALAQLTRRLLELPQHAARLASSQSISDYMLRLARKYVFSVIQGCSIEECYSEEQLCLAKEGSTKLTGYISASAYQLMKTTS